VNTLHFEPSHHLELVQADSDLAITGWDQPSIELTWDGGPDQCTVRRGEDTLTVTSQAALAIQVPKTTSIHILQASGDLLLRELGGDISIDTSHGDVSIRGGAARVSVQEIRGSLTAKGLAGPLVAGQVDGDVQLVDISCGQLNQVHGSLHARSITNALELGDVDGDIGVRTILGLLKIQNGHGNLQAHDLHGGLQADRIDGDLSLRAVPSTGQVYQAYSEGAIRARFPAETSARFDLKSDSMISAQLPLIEKQEPTQVVGQAGAGEADIILQSKSDLWVQMQDQTDEGFDPWKTMDSISSRIEAEIAQHLGRMSVDANTQREIDRAIRQAEQELAYAQHQLERETERARERAQRAQEKAAQAARRAQERIARKSRSWGMSINTASGLFGPPPPRHPHRPQPSRASEEEQLAILKMLQENKISVQEAEDLLRALEG